MGFNILDTLSTITKAQAEESSEYTEIVLDYKDIVVTKHNKYSMESLEEMATGIAIDGIQEPLILGRVRGEYWLVSGHRRIAGVDILVKEGQEQFRKVPCRYKDMTETQFRIALLVGNTFNRKFSDYDLMMQAREWKEVLTEAKKEGLVTLESGERIRDYVAQILGESTGKIGQLEAINNNATEDIKEQLKDGNIGITTAHAASQLSEEQQQEIASQAAEGKDLKSEEIIKMAEEEKVKKKQESVSESDTEQLEGQMNVTDYEGVVPEENKHVEIPQNATEKVADPKIYKKGEPREAITHYVKISAMFFEDAAAGVKNFELRFNDRDYRIGDTLHMTEYKDGHNTGRYIEQKIIYMLEDFAGLKENYCILGTKLTTGIEQE